jgi:hypothetical protein
MLNLPAAVTLNVNVAVVALPALGRTDLFAGLPGHVSGWGRTSDTSENLSPTLRWVANNIITNTVCTATYGPTVVIESTICTETTGGKGKCGGDTGGPLTTQDAGSHLQVGVASFGAGDGCIAGHPSGFTRVTSFREWIQTTSGV